MAIQLVMTGKKTSDCSVPHPGSQEEERDDAWHGAQLGAPGPRVSVLRRVWSGGAAGKFKLV